MEDKFLIEKKKKINEKFEKIMNNKVVNIILKFRYIFEFILSVISVYLLFNVMYFAKYENYINKAYLIPFVICTIVLISNIVINFLVSKKELDKIFLNIMIPLGVSFAILMLPYDVPDESSHVFRAYNISKGNIIVDTEIQRDIMPKDLVNIEHMQNYKNMYDTLHKNTDYDSENEELYNAFSSYFPICYFVPSVAFLIGRLCNINMIITVILARLFNLILFLIVGSWCLKHIPIGKLVLFIYLLMPMNIHQVASVSADCFINASAILFITYVLYLRFKDVEFNTRRKVVFTVLALMITCTKHVYFPLVFLSAIFLFNKKFKKNDKIFFGVIMALMTIIALSWYAFTTVYVDVREYILQNNVNASEQLKYIITHPMTFIKTFMRTIKEYGTNYIFEFLGHRLGYLNIPIREDILMYYLFLLLIAPFLEKNEYSLKRSEKVWCVLISLGIFCIILLGLYLTWSPVGFGVIGGVQGRYFFPVAILLLLCLIKKDKYIEFKNTKPVVATLVTCVNIYAIAKVVLFYLV